ncbi:MAG TPA: hypothetical protein VF868_01440 [Bacteroidia bacterium]|jgi:hypothetical protein
MKNKKLLFILIPVAILVWGNIAWKIFMAMNGEDTVEQKIHPPIVPATGIAAFNDTFSISLDYRDPFLAKPVRKPAVSGNHQATTVPSNIPPKKGNNENFPSIVYTGIIKNEKSKKELVLVQINGQNYTMKVGDIASEVQLLKVMKDAIEVKHGNIKKRIEK